jgi:hypothetical protein
MRERIAVSEAGQRPNSSQVNAAMFARPSDVCGGLMPAIWVHFLCEQYIGVAFEPNVVFDTERNVFFRLSMRFVCDRGTKSKTNSAHSLIAYA